VTNAMNHPVLHQTLFHTMTT